MPTNHKTPKRKYLGWGTVTFILVAILIMTIVPQPAQRINAQPELLALAAEQPNARVNVIVQKSIADDSAADLVSQLGGEITQDLLGDAVDFACAAAAINVSRKGCSPPTQKEVQDFIASTRRQR